MTATPTTAAATRTWEIDSAHTVAQFAVRHLMIATVKGTFGDVSGTVQYEPGRPDSLVVNVKIPVASIDTREAKRDAHLRSADFFAADEHPHMTFTGKRLEGDMTDRFRLIGDLTIRGVTREVVLDVKNEGTGSDPWGNERLGVSATTKINRADFGLTWNMALEAGGVMVSDEVKVSLDIELVRSSAAAKAAA